MSALRTVRGGSVRTAGSVFCLKLAACILTLWVVLAPTLSHAGPDWMDRVRAAAASGAVLVTDGAGNVVFSHNADRPLVPASTLKVLTAGAALEALGPDYRFVTEFRLSPGGDLHVVGRGDPFLVSEELAVIAAELKKQGLIRVNNIYLDNRFFSAGLVMDGTSRSLNPYDAYNGALCVNFNTVFVNVGPDGVQSAEPQTPLTPLARQIARQSGSSGRVRCNLAESPDTCLQYAGELFRTFLEQAGVEVAGQVETAPAGTGDIPLFYRHLSRKNLRWLVGQMFEYSNNFMANQIFLTMGAERYGPPADLEKSRRAVGDFLATLDISGLHIEEGSGLSRRTTISAKQMSRVLSRFMPYREMMTSDGRAWFKTGTLSDVKAMAGYLVPSQGAPFIFTILLNGPDAGPRTRERILAILEDNLL